MDWFLYQDLFEPVPLVPGVESWAPRGNQPARVPPAPHPSRLPCSADPGAPAPDLSSWWLPASEPVRRARGLPIGATLAPPDLIPSAPDLPWWRWASEPVWQPRRLPGGVTIAEPPAQEMPWDWLPSPVFLGPPPKRQHPAVPGFQADAQVLGGPSLSWDWLPTPAVMPRSRRSRPMGGPIIVEPLETVALVTRWMQPMYRQLNKPQQATPWNWPASVFVGEPTDLLPAAEQVHFILYITRIPRG